MRAALAILRAMLGVGARREPGSTARRSMPVVLVLGSLAFAGSGGALASGGTPVVCQSLASLVPCFGFAPHPKEMGLGSDGRTTLISLKWRHWGEARATAHGRERENGAAAGAPPSYTYASITVTVSHPTLCNRRRAYTTVRIAGGSLASTYRGCVPHASFSSTASSGETVYFPQSQEASSPAYKPSTLEVAGEGSFIVEHTHWRAWSTARATGTGTGVYGYAGRPHYRDPVEIVLSRPRRLCGHEEWTRGLFDFIHAVPPEVPRHWTWRLGVFPCGA